MLAREHPHARDADISFDPVLHAYRIRPAPGRPFLGRHVMSTTALVAAHFPAFDADQIIARHWRGWQLDAGSRYHGMEPRAIKEAWRRKGEEARRLGTALHALIEDSLNGTERDGSPTGLEREWALFQRFRATSCWVPWRTEFAVFDEASRVCGTIDALVRTLDGGFVILDWKRTAKDLCAGARDWGRRGRGACADTPDTPHHRYSLQLSIYRVILETRYGIAVSACMLAGLGPHREVADVVVCTDLRAAARSALSARARLVRNLERWRALARREGRRATRFRLPTRVTERHRRESVVHYRR